MTVQRRNIALGVLLGLLIVNAVLFFTYRVRQQERINELKQKRDQLEASLLEAESQRMAKEQQLAGYTHTQDEVHRIYDQTWSTLDQRLVTILREVYRLSAKSALVPKAITYQRAPGRKQNGTETMAISFSVDGRYDQIRNLISLIEHSSQFISIGSVSLTSQAGEILSLRLEIRTLFKSADSTPADLAKGPEVG